MPKTCVLASSDPKALPAATKTIRRGGLLVFPTDTLYGLACSPYSPAALRRLYHAKGRSISKAIPVLIGDASQLETIVDHVPTRARALMNAYWPGALTLVLPKAEGLPRLLTPYPGLAVRMPGHEFAANLLKTTGPLAVTSANLSDQPNPQTVFGVLSQLFGRVNLILDGGTLTGGQASTIVDCTGMEPKLLREGPISFERVLEIWQSTCME